MHKLIEVSLGGRLNLAPIPPKSTRILDIATGTSIWAVEMGITLPFQDCRVALETPTNRNYHH